MGKNTGKIEQDGDGFGGQKSHDEQLIKCKLNKKKKPNYSRIQIPDSPYLPMEEQECSVWKFYCKGRAKLHKVVVSENFQKQ